MHTIDFYFDCSSPWTYLAFEALVGSRAHTVAQINWHPILVGGIFNTINPTVYAAREQPVPAKQRYAAKDLQDWARYVGIEIGSPPVFPVNSVRVMRGAFVAIEEDCLVDYARVAFQRYWRDLADISQEAEVRHIAQSIGLDVDAFWDKINSEPYKAKLRDNTQALIDKGGFGSPTLFVDGDDMYFGNDRLPLMLHKLSVN